MICGAGVRAGGFTLLELLLAIAIFSLVAVMAYGGLDRVMQQSEIVRDGSARLERVQSGLARLQEDLRFAIDRPVRDALGGQVTAFEGGTRGLFTFTRMGRVNPWVRPRSQLSRIAWRLNGDRLERARLDPVDGTVDSSVRAPVWTPKIEGVRDVEVVFYDDRSRDFPVWPPPDRNEATVPQVVEIRLQLDRMPPLRMTVELARGWPRAERMPGAGG